MTALVGVQNITYDIVSNVDLKKEISDQLGAIMDEAFQDIREKDTPPWTFYIRANVDAKIMIFNDTKQQQQPSIVGFLQFCFRTNDKELYIYNMSILPAWQRKGIGTAAIQVLELLAKNEQTKQLSCKVGLNREMAVSFWKKMKFVFPPTTEQGEQEIVECWKSI